MPLGGHRMRRQGQQESQANPMLFRERLQRAEAVNSPNVNPQAVQQPAQQQASPEVDFLKGMVGFYAGVGKGIVKRVQGGAKATHTDSHAGESVSERREEYVTVDD